ncbi:MAG: flavodoxin [Ruminococcaceae bacterium]|nr:flavodoxin [Oscillospiraceae bacterium]
MFKKLFILCITIVMVCLLSGCNNVPSPNSGTSVNSNNGGVFSDNKTSTAESESGINISSGNNNNSKTNEDEPQTDAGILIAYFSWSGHTKQLAEEIQNLTGGDIFEVIPETPYTDDINELSGIASREQRDNARPQLAAHIDDISKYDTVFVGYPNWWNNMPMPVFTFLEEYDLSGKTVIPFTSYGNGVWSKSVNSLKETLPNSTIKDGLAVQENNFNSMPQEVREWLLKLEIIQ